MESYFDLEWPVAPRHEWRDWIGPGGSPVAASDGDDRLPPYLFNRYDAAAGNEVGPVLTPIEGDHTKIYPLRMEHDGLFEEFADLDPNDRVAILSFANSYGLLGIALQYQVIRGTKPAMGESLEGWKHAIQQMRYALHCFEHPEPFTPPEEDLKAFGSVPKDDLRRLFDLYLSDVRAEFAFDKTGRPEIQFKPKTLLAAMWIQLAESGGKRYAKCKQCRKRIVIAAGGEQGTYSVRREFCDNNNRCKQAYWRQSEKKRRRKDKTGNGKTKARPGRRINR
jgi:hypothetical protein